MKVWAFLLLFLPAFAWANCNDSIDNDGDGLTDFGEDLGCTSAADSTETAPADPDVFGPSMIPISETGWPIFTPSGDSRIVYVSTSGSDSNDGLSDSTPKQTIAAAYALMRDGYPDWMLLKRGDTWSETLGQICAEGRSATEPMVFSSYGTDADPPTLNVNSSHLNSFGGGCGGTRYDYLVYYGISFINTAHDPDHGDWDTGSAYVAMDFLLGHDHIWFVDVTVGWGQVNVARFDPYTQNHVTFWRSKLYESFGTTASGSHVQCIYVNDTSNITLVETYVDMCGWHDSGESGNALLSHALYFGAPTDAEIYDSLIMRASSNGIQCRTGCYIQGSIFSNNPINIFIDNDDISTIDDGIVNTTILDAVDVPVVGTERGWGIDIQNADSTGGGVEVTNPLFSGCTASGCANLTTSVGGSANTSGDIVYDYAGTLTGSTSPYTDNTRDLIAYETANNGGTTLDDFADSMRAQNRFDWDDDYRIPTIANWIRAGFDMTAFTPFIDAAEAAPDPPGSCFVMNVGGGIYSFCEG